MKKYKAIFFDWDGTAVENRSAPVDRVVPQMESLLLQGVKLFIISGTTYENIAGGRLHETMRPEALKNLYMGLGRGAYDYALGKEGPRVLHSAVPDRDTLLKIHRLAFDIHAELLEQYGYPTDIVFSRPNYCKIDMLVAHDRRGQLFLQEGELDMLNDTLASYGCKQGIRGVIDRGCALGEKCGLQAKITTDAKYLEAGLTTKSDNVDYFLQNVVFPAGGEIGGCCFWGDEFSYLGEGIVGSDGLMITGLSKNGDFYDVSRSAGRLPAGVAPLGGGVETFLHFLAGQAQA